MKKINILKKSLLVITAIALLIGLSVIGCAAEGTENAAAAVEDNFFAELYATVEEFSSEILCALTFIGSLIIAFAYKMGLLPTVTKGINSIGNAIGTIKENTELYTAHQEEIISAFNSRLKDAENILVRFGEAIEEIREKTEDGALAQNDRKEMKTLMSAQIDMLYDIFMTSSLPQYQKDAVNEKIAAMKEGLAVDGQENQ